MRKIILSTLAVAGLAIAPVLVPASANAAPTLWGAIAVADDGAMGSAWNYPTKDEAKAAAMNQCHGPNCEVLVSFTGCGAVSHSKFAREYNGRYGDTRWEAEDNARVHHDSTILKSVCNEY
ncbi:DUF4189 domain-containing protein [Nocardia sp. 2]|uniref:DUF4189 domain-containing protein n=1 Tax=Nocardia acididurans TaxID=2802282 RepID=A0ABS1MAJ1_9NOCA|nr:DUF4189 domain-containing protein [Nocardia acididurans]MBL1077660.1 DUF4189 domain-containing protein [Nocardia acididurans]